MKVTTPDQPLPDAGGVEGVLVLIEAGAGGREAARFAAELYQMYARFAASCDWEVELLGKVELAPGLFKKVVFAVRGHEAFSFLTYETGVDRVQRVPEDERQGRIYTSTAVVTVIRHDVPEARWLLDEEVYRLFASYQERGTERPPGSRASGDRREKIRTYNFPDDRVTDHRIGFHIYGVRDVLGGNLGPLLDELRKRDQG